jgi:predicted lactoylglutathione lyase
MMFVNLPVTDLDRAVRFYTALGFTQNLTFTDQNASCLVVEEDHNALMLLVRDFFQTFSDRPVGDPATTVSVTTAVFKDSRDEVDAVVTAGLAAGGVEERPASDYGFMYQRQLADPDGNIIEFGWMDPVAAAQGPAAAAQDGDAAPGDAPTSSASS